MLVDSFSQTVGQKSALLQEIQSLGVHLLPVVQENQF